jgi:hypothetical protein
LLLDTDYFKKNKRKKETPRGKRWAAIKVSTTEDKMGKAKG